MNRVVVVDSTCLIGLERVDRLDLLPNLYDTIIIPPAVAREFGVSLEWLRVEPPDDQALVDSLLIAVDEGEAEVIAVARERGYMAILDDRRARVVAKRLGIVVVGTVGVLLRAKRAGLIPSLRPVLNELEDGDFRMSAALRTEALRLAGE
jgi:uncharacterized protein